MLSAAGEHAVRLTRTAGHQVIDENPEVGFAALRQPGLMPSKGKRGIDSGGQALGRGLFVAGRPVDLACEEQAVDHPRLERGVQIPWVEEVVLDGIPRAREVRVLEAPDGAHELPLHIERQARGDAVRVDLVSAEPFGLDEDLVRALVGEPEYLVLDRWTVARAYALDRAREHG